MLWLDIGIGWLGSRSQMKANVDKDEEKLKPSYIVADKVKWFSPCGK